MTYANQTRSSSSLQDPLRRVLEEGEAKKEALPDNGAGVNYSRRKEVTK
jgi:hypothetical protein